MYLKNNSQTAGKIYYQCFSPPSILSYCKILFWESQNDQNRVSITAMCLKPEIKDGTVSLDKKQYVESETVTVQCDSGYSVVGSPSIICSENRTWYPEVPKCEWVSGRHSGVFYHIVKIVTCSRALFQPTLMRSDFYWDSFLSCLNQCQNQHFYSQSTCWALKASSNSLIL